MRIGVFEQDAVSIISMVPRRRGVQWLDEINASGSGQFEIHLDDPVLAEFPTLLDQFNVVKVYVNGVAIKAWIIEDVNPTRISGGEDADRWVQISGRGALSVLESAIVYPEYGIRELVSEDRNFNFASKDGDWRKPSEWVNSVGVAWTADTTARAKNPKDWPDPVAEWLWSSSPVVAAPPGRNWFRREFTLETLTNIVVFATCDNEFVGYMDGEVILASGLNRNAFRSRFEWRMTLAAGDHTLGFVVTNFDHVGSNSPGALIYTVYRTNDAGEPTDDIVLRSAGGATTIVKPYGKAPGWNGAAILQQCIEEAQDRDVVSVVPITFSFTAFRDSNNILWDDIQERIVKVGTTDLYDLGQQIVELSMDYELDANFVLNAWKKRGIDRSTDIHIMPNRDVTAAAGTIRAGKLRNQALLKFEGGWMELFSAASKEEYGRREVGISLGTSSSTDQTALAGSELVREVARPERTIPMSYTSEAGPQPYTDYGLGDSVYVPDVYTGMVISRLMSVAGSEQDNGVVNWDLDFYPVVPDDKIDTVIVSTGGSYNDDSALYQAQVLSDSPWGYWRLDESGTPFTDYSGNGRRLAVFIPGGGAEPDYDQSGPVNRAVLFKNTPMYADTATTARFTAEYATLECWIRMGSKPTGADRSTILGMAIEYGAGTHDKAIGLNPDGSVFFYVAASVGQTYLTSTVQLTLNQWYHVVGSVGTEGAKLYLDGSLNRHVPGAVDSYNNAGQRIFLRGGGAGINNQTPFVLVAEPAVYYQQLFASRVKSHYEASGFNR